MKRIVITGGNGFIGRYAIPELLRLGYEVHAFSRSSKPPGKNLFWHQIDILSESPRELLQKIKPTHCMHLAWVTTHGEFWQSPENHKWLKASNLLIDEFIKAGGRRFVASGTCAEYTWNNEICIEGQTPEVPATLYGQCKKQFTDRLASLNGATISTAVGRVFFLFGPGEPAARLIPSVIGKLMKKEDAKCSDGMQVRDFLYVTDEAAALVALADSAVEGVVNIGSGQPIHLRELLTELGELMGAPERILFGAFLRAANDPDVLLPSVARLRDEVGWKPGSSLRAGLVETIESLRKNPPA